MDSINCKHESNKHTTEKTKQNKGPFVKVLVWSPGRDSSQELGTATWGCCGHSQTGPLGRLTKRPLALIKPLLHSSSAAREAGFQKTFVPYEKQDGCSVNVLDGLGDVGVGQGANHSAVSHL